MFCAAALFSISDLLARCSQILPDSRPQASQLKSCCNTGNNTVECRSFQPELEIAWHPEGLVRTGKRSSRIAERFAARYQSARLSTKPAALPASIPLPA